MYVQVDDQVATSNFRNLMKGASGQSQQCLQVRSSLSKALSHMASHEAASTSLVSTFFSGEETVCAVCKQTCSAHPEWHSNHARPEAWMTAMLCSLYILAFMGLVLFRIRIDQILLNMHKRACC